MGSYVKELLLFESGRYAGHGWWANRQGGRGIYNAELSIAPDGDGDNVHTARRIFLNDNGTVGYEKQSQAIFKPAEDGFISIVLNYEGNDYYGQGYTWRNLCHFVVDLTKGMSLTGTFILSKGIIEVFGSAMKDNNLTVWAESLKEVSAGD
jgi:hypothetical protein